MSSPEEKTLYTRICQRVYDPDQEGNSVDIKTGEIVFVEDNSVLNMFVGKDQSEKHEIGLLTKREADKARILFEENSSETCNIKLTIQDEEGVAGKPSVYFYDANPDNSIGGRIGFQLSDGYIKTTQPFIETWQYSNGSLYPYAHEVYTLPMFTNITGTEVKNYEVLTSKNAVTIEQGGTGARDIDNARKNLGVPLIFPYTVEFSVDTIEELKMKTGDSLSTALFNHTPVVGEIFYFVATTRKGDICGVTAMITGDSNASGNSPFKFEETVLLHNRVAAIDQGGTGATTAEDARANLGAVNKAGDTMTGALTIQGHLTSTYSKIKNTNHFPSVGFYDETASDSNTIAGMWVDNSTPSRRQINFVLYNEDMDNAAGTDRYSERYKLPTPDAGLTRSKPYDILTSKNPVTIEQGGTGANDADAARKNLELLKFIRKDTCFEGDKLVHDGGAGCSATSLWISKYKFSPDGGKRETLNSIGLFNDKTTLDKPLTVESGGTGATTKEEARNNLQTNYCNNVVPKEYTVETGSKGDHAWVQYKDIVKNTVINKIDFWKDKTSLDKPLTVASGGTGAKDAVDARKNLGAAAESHTHRASDIKSGMLPVNLGGTGATDADTARTNLGIGRTLHLNMNLLSTKKLPSSSNAYYIGYIMIGNTAYSIPLFYRLAGKKQYVNIASSETKSYYKTYLIIDTDESFRVYFDNKLSTANVYMTKAE